MERSLRDRVLVISAFVIGGCATAKLAPPASAPSDQEAFEVADGPEILKAIQTAVKRPGEGGIRTGKDPYASSSWRR